jgi:uncharacterized protein (DUF1800 family)
MVTTRNLTSLLTAGLLPFLASKLQAADPLPRILSLSKAGSQTALQLAPHPATERFKILFTDDLAKPFSEVTNGNLSGYGWTSVVTEQLGFYRLEVVPVKPTAQLGATVLNRLSYGPTPDEIERVLTGPTAIGAEAYIEEQLAPERIAEDLDTLPAQPGWQFVTLTGTATGNSLPLYIYLDAAGEVYLDDLQLVTGSVAGVGANLLKNGDFESVLAGTWTVSANLAASTLSTDVKHAGNSALHLIASAAGSTRESAIWQNTAVVNGRTYTLSYWYLPTSSPANLTVRLSGRGVESTHSVQPGAGTPAPLHAKLSTGAASIDDLRAWLFLHAVQSQRQLLQVLLQFCDNHFTTFYPKSRDYIDGRLTNENDFTIAQQAATDFEFRELKKWRDVLLDPSGTFYDLLKISAESPAMVIYLDTVTSSGASGATPNENYARELVELFTFGVDNGYDQTDIEQMSRVWTGWRIEKLPPGQQNNPFATPVTNRDNDPGVWALWWRTSRHDTGAKTIFAGKKIDARFGPPRAGQSYELKLPARTGNAGMQDGYDLIKHLADLPYTQEFISVKLCQLFVHENFHHGVYDYTQPDLTPEAQLIKDCMAAWENAGPDGRKGNLRRVLRTIFASEVFRSQSSARQKVKTPLEFSVSCIRALRAAKTGGGHTAGTDGYDLNTPNRRLNMRLFYREAPDGWSEFGRDWINTSALVERMRFVENFLASATNPLKDVDYGGGGDDNVSDPVALLKLKLPAEQWRDAAAVADYFLGILFLGEGKANLDLDRAAALAFLNSSDSGAPNSSPFASLDPNSAAYDTRVRGMVALLMSLPRFQEQ